MEGKHNVSPLQGSFSALLKTLTKCELGMSRALSTRPFWKINSMSSFFGSEQKDQTEYNQRFDTLSQKFKKAEAKKDAVAQQISNGGFPPDSETAGQRGYRLQREALVRVAGLRHGLR